MRLVGWLLHGFIKPPAPLISIKLVLGDDQHYLQEAKHQEEFEADARVALFESDSTNYT